MQQSTNRQAFDVPTSPVTAQLATINPDRSVQQIPDSFAARSYGARVLAYPGVGPLIY